MSTEKIILPADTTYLPRELVGNPNVEIIGHDLEWEVKRGVDWFAILDGQRIRVRSGYQNCGLQIGKPVNWKLDSPTPPEQFYACAGGRSR